MRTRIKKIRSLSVNLKEKETVSVLICLSSINIGLSPEVDINMRFDDEDINQRIAESKKEEEENQFKLNPAALAALNKYASKN